VVERACVEAPLCTEPRVPGTFVTTGVPPGTMATGEVMLDVAP
jgi:hypothetical protein